MIGIVLAHLLTAAIGFSFGIATMACVSANRNAGPRR